MKGRFCKVLLGLLDWVGKMFVKGKEKIVLDMVMHFEMILAYVFLIARLREVCIVM